MDLVYALNAALDETSPTNHEFFHKHVAAQTGCNVYQDDGGTHDWVEATIAKMKEQGATEAEVQRTFARYVSAHYQERL